jgi:hypothetical protein
MAIDELDFYTLIPCVQEYLIKHQDSFLQENPIEILETVYQHESFTSLWNYCFEKICENPKILFDSNNFTSIKAPLLKLFLGLDYLDLDEIFIWNSLLEWGIAQNPTVSQDITKWSREDITIMKRTLHEFIPLVRFHHISSDDFLIKVYPIKELLPNDLADELVKFNIAQHKQPNIYEIQPPRQSKLINYDSTLIERQHFAIFASWIDNKDLPYNISNIPYKFNLLYRASRDGNTVEAFHSRCDNKGATIAVAKVANSEQIVGGYNPFYWDLNSSWMSTFDSFIYFFADMRNIRTAKVSYSNGNPYSIGNDPNFGPVFGGGWDLYCHANGMWCSDKITFSSYPNIDGMPDRFNVGDYEVFQVIRK